MTLFRPSCFAIAAKTCGVHGVWLLVLRPATYQKTFGAFVRPSLLRRPLTGRAYILDQMNVLPRNGLLVGWFGALTLASRRVHFIWSMEAVAYAAVPSAKFIFGYWKRRPIST